MQIRSEVFAPNAAKLLTNKQANNDDYITSLADVTRRRQYVVQKRNLRKLIFVSQIEILRGKNKNTSRRLLTCQFNECTRDETVAGVDPCELPFANCNRAV